MGAKGVSRPYDPGSFLVSDYMFWAPLIALMSGARVGEIAQLRPSDLRSQDGILVFDINADGNKSLKSAGTARLIPVHPRLVQLGIVELAGRRSGRDLLLPEVPSPIKGDHGAGLSKWMSGRFLPRLKLKTRDGLGFHGFRHTLKTMLRTAAVSDSVSNYICGHGARTVDERYGIVELAAAAAAIEKLVLPKVIDEIPHR
jgi:integrase